MTRWSQGLGLIAGLGTLAFAVASACLPDLPPNTCGDGHIDESALEECDPGPNATNPGCASNCSIICQPSGVDDTRTYYFDPGTRHCYFSPTGTQTNSEAEHACLHDEKAHLVTLVDSDELEQGLLGMNANFLSSWPESDPRFWVGLSANGRSGPYLAAAPYEPGWAVTSTCAGCFLQGVGESLPPIADGGAEAGTPEYIVATSLTTSGNAVMEVMGGNAKAKTICEREPVGARSVPCFGGAFCFTVLATVGNKPPKAYLYNPSPLTASQADAYCHGLTDAGQASLVVLESRSEREQIIYELSQIPLLPKGILQAPTQFWIGLATAPAGSGSGWIWDDGVRASPTSTGSRPSVWGNSQGRVQGAEHAYILLQGTYDDGLAYARLDSDEIALPFVCQYH